MRVALPLDVPNKMISKVATIKYIFEIVSVPGQTDDRSAEVDYRSL